VNITRTGVSTGCSKCSAYVTGGFPGGFFIGLEVCG
jgi:hypothetical protein